MKAWVMATNTGSQCGDTTGNGGTMANWRVCAPKRGVPYSNVTIFAMQECGPREAGFWDF